MALRSKDTIFNAALLKCGREDTETGGSGDLWRAMDSNYDEIVRAAFEDGDGNLPFGRQREALTSRSASEYDFDDAYELPDGCLQVVEVYFDDYSASDLEERWETDGESIHLDASSRAIEIEYVKAGQESKWSANFALGIQRRLEAVIYGFLEEYDDAELRDQQADVFFMKSGIKASKNRSQRRVWKRGGGRLVRTRRRRYS